MINILAAKKLNLAAEKLEHFTLENKRLALEALDVRIWIDGEQVTLEGVLPIPEENMVPQPS